MNELFTKLQQPLFVAGVAGTVKLVLDSFGIHIPDATINAAVDGAAAVVSIIGIVKDHGKPQLKPPEQPTQIQPPSQP